MKLPSLNKTSYGMGFQHPASPLIYPLNWANSNAALDISCGSCKADCEGKHDGNEDAILECYLSICHRLCVYNPDELAEK